MSYWPDATLIAVGAASVALGTAEGTSGALAVGGAVLFGSFLMAVGGFSGLETAVRRGSRVPAGGGGPAGDRSDDVAGPGE